MTIDDFLELDAVSAQAKLLTMAYASRSPFVKAYSERHGVNLEFNAPRQEKSPSGAWPLAAWGWVLITIGAVTSALAYFYSVGVSVDGPYGLQSEVANLDKVAVRHMLLGSGLALFVSGWVAVSADFVAGEVRKLRLGSV